MQKKETIYLEVFSDSYAQKLRSEKSTVTVGGTGSKDSIKDLLWSRWEVESNWMTYAHDEWREA